MADDDSDPIPDPGSPYDPDRITRELDWNLLRTFVVLAEARSVTDAAERLRLTQPSVSTALKRLEDRIGRKLIERGPGKYALTEAGELLYREALDINGSILRLSTLMREMTDAVRGHVTIAVASHVVCPVFDRLLADFHEAHPEAVSRALRGEDPGEYFDISTKSPKKATVGAQGSLAGQSGAIGLP